jgi:hypothetical protein
MTEETLREIELNCNREDIPRLVGYIRKLQLVIEQCKEIMK